MIALFEEGDPVMKLYAPDCYREFRCIADRCRHTCCAGWEIDIDEDTARAYQKVPGEIGERLRQGMARTEDGSWHFVTDGRERCPMLTERNLCSLITAFGEVALCQICADHPRFRNDLADRTEIGLGLCCEAAVALQLRRRQPMTIVLLEDDGFEDEADPEELAVLALRERLIGIAQRRELPLEKRIDLLAQQAGTRLPPPSDGIVGFLLTLERMDDAWADALKMLEQGQQVKLSAELDIPLEQLLVLLLYRHMPAAAWEGNAPARARLCICLWQLVRDLLAVGEPTRERLEELTRLMSS